MNILDRLIREKAVHISEFEVMDCNSDYAVQIADIEVLRPYIELASTMYYSISTCSDRVRELIQQIGRIEHEPIR